MTTRFRIDSFTLGTTGGDVIYDFPSDLTIISGPTGVGKTSLLELLKFALGGKGKLSPVARHEVHETSLDLTIADARVRIRRSLDSQKRKTARVWDLSDNQRLPDHYIDNGTPSLSSFLMERLGFPADMRAAARSGASSRAGALISFNDVLSFLYVPQYDINRDIANSAESYLNPKRQSLFELLFGLTDSKLLAMRSDINTLKAEIDKAQSEHATILAFMNESRTTSRMEAEQALDDARRQQIEAEAQQRVLAEDLDPVTDRETLALRDLLSEAERSFAEAKSVYDSTLRERSEYAAERRRVQQDRERLRRMQDAGARLAKIEFAFCPRCMQRVSGRETSVDTCCLCLLPEPSVDSATIDAAETYEMHQLATQVAEIDDQLLVLESQLEGAASAILKREELVLSLSTLIDNRSRDRISPRLQAYGDVVEALAVARTRQEQIEMILRQWERAAQLGDSADELATRREKLKRNVADAEDLQSRRHGKLIEELDHEFERAILTLGVPGVETASINPVTYLPLLNGERFQDYSSGGGAITATQIAYWTSLIRVALRMEDTSYPAFVLIDSPRLALNTSESIAAALYQHLADLVLEFPGKLQLIVADNEIPAAYRRDFAELAFTYDSPTVSTVKHPGPANVVTISRQDEDAD